MYVESCVSQLGTNSHVQADQFGQPKTEQEVQQLVQQALDGTDVCYIAAATQPNANEVFETVEPIMKALGGRPHWGKCFTLTRAEAEAMYPDTDEQFRTLRATRDPKGVFSNELIHRFFD